MNKKAVIIEEKGLDIPAGKTMILNLIKNQIQDYKRQFLSDWVQNHETSSSVSTQKIKNLKDAKKELQELLDNFDNEDSQIDINFNLEIKVTNKKEQHKMEESMAV
ncbi:hypothetical protein [Marinigracilibium pacificum]|uniref:Uncharacterized protein n=1 Tax=Marinigracilibium pacificum TaxID=2729599 RepID=A0A848J3A1_9BACT|nr:hypothetical protein [Marinigracilibium pacificum]NMM49010.1 hypothetical protein [Marinigracilibium pacificum]